MKRLLIIKAGSTTSEIAAAHGDFEDWIIERLQRAGLQTVVCAVHRGQRLPDSDSCSGVVITGSHAMVSDREPWSERTAAWLRAMLPRPIPVLGICYGHQLLAHALGGEVAHHARGAETGTVEVRLTDEARSDPLARHLPASFAAHASHWQTVVRLPADAIVLARNAHEPHHIVRFGALAWGVQFHPEFNADVMRAYIVKEFDATSDRDRMLEGVRETPESAAVLRHFAQLIV